MLGTSASKSPKLLKSNGIFASLSKPGTLFVHFRKLTSKNLLKCHASKSASIRINSSIFSLLSVFPASASSRFLPLLLARAGDFFSASSAAFAASAAAFYLSSSSFWSSSSVFLEFSIYLSVSSYFSTESSFSGSLVNWQPTVPKAAVTTAKASAWPISAILTNEVGPSVMSTSSSSRGKHGWSYRARRCLSCGNLARKKYFLREMRSSGREVARAARTALLWQNWAKRGTA